MTLHRRNPKRDANEQDIADHLRMRGAFVAQVSGVGVPDLLVAFRGRWQPCEVKSATGALTRDQVAWHAAARSVGCPVRVLRSRADADRLLNDLAGVMP